MVLDRSCVHVVDVDRVGPGFGMDGVAPSLGLDDTEHRGLCQGATGAWQRIWHACD